MQKFVHLHLHSEYSLLDGACRVAEIPKRARECGHDAVALTDHGVMFGSMAFYRACIKEGVKPIIGCEVYVAPGSRFEKSTASGSPFHLVLLCENNEGYNNLMQLVSKGFTEGFYSKPRVDMELLRQYKGGLIALSACLAGAVPRRLVKGEYEAAKAEALRYRELFGEEHFYIELQNHGIAEQKQILPDLVRLSRECNIPTVATNDCHYLRRRDAEVQSVLMCIQMGTTVAEGRPQGFETDEFYYKSTEEMAELFSAYPEALENTCRIAERCNVSFDFEKTYLPKFPCPAGVSAEQHLRALTEEGFLSRVERGHIAFGTHTEKEYRDRLAYELDVIVSMGYADYFLIVQDYVNFAKSRDIPVGPGRGSGAGSLVAFALGITDIDSIRFDLLFERFLNPERVSMPDIDIDFCYTRRDEVIAYVTERYGRDHVSQIVTFGTLAARAAIRDVGRVLGMPYAEVDAVAKAVPQELDISLTAALERKQLKEMYEESNEVRRLVDTALAIEGMPRNVSIHAAGIVITDRPVSEYVPLAVSNGVVVTQYDMDTVAALGVLKFDFLALRYLTIIHDAEKQIREDAPTFDISKIPLDDAATYDLISKGNTAGVFQLESPGMRNMLMNLRPENIDDIIAAIALFRPGPMDSIPRYVEARHNPSAIHYDVPELEPILRSTYGCTVYQEQVMQIFRELAGYTFGHADIVRRAMAKKKASVLEAERTGFLNGCEAHGITRETANKLFDDLSAFANYAFNKSHAAAYAVISYRTAYLKAHAPKEYFSALLTSVLGNLPKMAEYTAECAKYRIRVLPPDINESFETFHVDGDNIRFGLLALKNVGQQFVRNIIRERESGAFVSFEDFVDRMSASDLNKRMVETLVKAGAFDRLGTPRSRLVAVYEQILDRVGNKNRSNLEGQMDMFSMARGGDVGDISFAAFRYPEIPEYSLKERLALEKEVSGMYFSGHPFDAYRRHADDLHAVPLSLLATAEGEETNFADRQRITVAGTVVSVTYKNQKNGGRMAFFTVEDRTGSAECIAFADRYEKYGHLVRVDSAVAVDGTVSVRDEESAKVLVGKITPLMQDDQYENANPQPHARPAGETVWKQGETSTVEKQSADRYPQRPRRLCLRVPDLRGEPFEKAKNLVSLFEGETLVLFYSLEDKSYHQGGGVLYSEYVHRQFAELLGEENVVYQK